MNDLIIDAEITPRILPSDAGLKIPGVGNLGSIYTTPNTPDQGFRIPGAYPFITKALREIPFAGSVIGASIIAGLDLTEYGGWLSRIIGRPVENVMVRTSINGWLFDAIFRTSVSHLLRMTSHPVQTGANITDHSFLEPRSITMSIGMSDATPVSYTQFATGEGRSIRAWETLKTLQESRVPLEVLTRFGIYNNMLITSLTASEDYRTSSALMADVTFEEMLIAETSVVQVSSLPSKTDTTRQGELQGQPIDNGSILGQIEGVVFG